MDTMMGDHLRQNYLELWDDPLLQHTQNIRKLNPHEKLSFNEGSRGPKDIQLNIKRPQTKRPKIQNTRRNHCKYGLARRGNKRNEILGGFIKIKKLFKVTSMKNLIDQVRKRYNNL
ncbi:hypothetical protein OXYTRIMIC_517 [Oxytricha trifallax]|uniref:Uncharacterized protein n=1 Tax=Oxytricha trifallax TaxID=1172189 RepID=A0A073HZC6_9SPIT|nr:hypothetical protein OXYTRIMIC_517 [Oxytricha trifallax]